MTTDSRNMVPVQCISLPEVEGIARHAVKSGLYRDLAANESAAVMLALRCQAEGIHPGLAFSQFHIIEGKPAMRSDAMLARFQQAGGRIRWIKSDKREATAEFWHPTYSPDPLRITWTIEEAISRGIAKGAGGIKPNWVRFPEAMLRARTISAGVRAVLPGVVCGVYTPEELADEVLDVIATPPPDATPAPAIGAAAGRRPTADYPTRCVGPTMRDFRVACDEFAQTYGTTVDDVLRRVARNAAEAGAIPHPPAEATTKELARVLFQLWKSDHAMFTRAVEFEFGPAQNDDLDDDDLNAPVPAPALTSADALVHEILRAEGENDD